MITQNFLKISAVRAELLYEVGQNGGHDLANNFFMNPKIKIVKEEEQKFIMYFIFSVIGFWVMDL
jgi:hypothetical protein